jgi:hypothetical protein
MVHLLMGERRGLNPRVVDSQSTALIHLATSAPTPAQVSVSIYDQILSELPYDRLSKRSFFLYKASLFLCFGIRGKKASTSRSFLARLQIKQRGWAVHFIDLTSLYLRLKIGAGRAVKAHLVDSERAASTYSYQNEKKQAELEEASLYQRKSHCALAGFQTCAPLNYKLSLKPLLHGIFEEALFYKPFYNII